MEITQLGNGLRIIFEQMEHARSAAISLFIGCGSRFEAGETCGASHFIEHMVFKGTENRTALMIAEQMDEMGGQINAYTTKEYTCIYAQVLESHATTAFDIIADMVTSPLMDEGDIDTEKGIVLEEINMYQDSPEELCMDRLYESIWPDSPLGANIAGTKESVSGLTRGVLLSHMDRYYRPERMVVSVCGRFDEQAMMKKIEEYFGGLQNTGRPIAGEPTQFRRNITLYKKDFEQTHIVLGAEGLPLGDSRRYACAIFSNIAGGSWSSRLNQRIREELGLAYTVYSFSTSHLCGGVFGIAAGIAHENQQRTIEEIIEITGNLQNGVDDKELKRTKEQFKAGLVMGFETASSRASSWGRTLLLENRIITEDDMLEGIDRLTAEDIRDVAGYLLRSGKFSLSVVGDAKDEGFYSTLLNQS